MTNIVKPGSVTRRKGCLRIETTYSLKRVYGTYTYRFVNLPVTTTVSEYVLGRWYMMCMTLCMTFFATDKVYYVDGNYGIWETDIRDISDVVFNPVCREKGRVVNFRKMEKEEWLFI